MKVYQAPKMKLERLSLFEKIAETCWGYKKAFFDNPYDGVTNLVWIEFTNNPGCGDSSGQNDVLNWLKGILGNDYDKYRQEYPNNSNNLANTKAHNFTLSNS